ncbi:MAG: phenylalanine--tRNA ligase subunit beta [Proteobacteria bacterium]|nr:phenylalanine--tRNA ligase subunit beta [Pseudomonadota bacterium]
MKFTLNWLKEHLDTNASLAEIADKLTALGLEVEGIQDRANDLAPFRVAEILEAEKHPNADKLRVCKVNTGSEVLQIVCGAPNARAGIKVVLAPVGVTIPANGLVIKKSKIRDVESNGMLCSATELALGDDSDGIIELPASAKAGEPAINALGANDPVIEIAITPNRGDCLGVRGVARDLAAAGLGTLKPLESKQVKGSFASPITVSIEDTKKAPLFIGRYFKNVKNTESPDWLKTRLKAIGLKPISALVDITNYLTFDLGRPAHVYDAKLLNGNLTVRDSKEGEAFESLADKTYKLSAGHVVIADGKGPVALGGVIGGKASGVSDKTTDVFLEIALFDPAEVAKSGRALMIDSDARYRFERHVDPAFAHTGADIASALITETCGGEASEYVKAGSADVPAKSVSFTNARVKTLAGVDVPAAEIARILSALGFKQEGEAVSAPSFRPDIDGEADIVEEVVRIFGYDKMDAVPLPTIRRLKPTLTPAQRAVSHARRLLAARGLHESVTFSFMDGKFAPLFGNKEQLIALANPISSDLSTMRPSILPNLMQAAAKNAARGAENVGFFEVGPVFAKSANNSQELVAAGIRTNLNHAKNIYKDSRSVDALDAKADLIAALSPYIPDASRLNLTRDVPSHYHPGRAGAYVLGKNVIGYFGELHPAVVKALGLEGSIVGFELFLERLPQPKTAKNTARAKLMLSQYQSVLRDFAFIVNEEVTADTIVRAVRQAEKTLVTEVSLFDVYQGKGIDSGKKSIAFSVKLEPHDRTLTDAEIEHVSNTIIAAVEKSAGGVLRK